MFNSKYMECVTLTSLLGLVKTMFGAMAIFRTSFAKITSAPQEHDDNRVSDQFFSNGPSSNIDHGESSNSSESSETSSAIDDSESQVTESSKGQESAADVSSESDTTEGNPLREEIMDKVNQDFTNVGMPSLEW